MKSIGLFLGMILAAGALLVGAYDQAAAQAEDALKSGTVLQRTELKDAKGTEAILVLREIPPGKESGKHTQSGNEIVYVLEGSVVFEAQGKAPMTLKAGDTFQTSAGEVHNVKNASSTDPAKALAFYVAKKGTRLEELSRPAK